MLLSQMWHTPVILALKNLRQEGRELKASLGYSRETCRRQDTYKLPSIKLFYIAIIIPKGIKGSVFANKLYSVSPNQPKTESDSAECP